MIQPGDVILVHRRSTLRAWLRHPISSLISARIRATTGSKWNHVACVTDRHTLALGQKAHWIVEAEWNKGVVRGILEDCYPPDQYEIAVAKPPAEVDRNVAVTLWQNAVGKLEYDMAGLALIKAAAIFGGYETMRRRLQNDFENGVTVCSELAAAGWFQGGMREALTLIAPGDFAEYVQP